MVETGKPNVGADMLRVHRVITRGLEVSAQRSAEFAQTGFSSAAIREGFQVYLRAMAGVLNAHHLAEDEVMFPYFREKMPDAPYDKLMADHRAIVGVLERLDMAIEAVAASAGSADSLRALKGILAMLSGLWRPHIGIEEALWNPEAIAGLMNEEENLQLGQKVGESSQKHLHSPQVEIPFLLYNLAPGDREIMAKAMPPAVTQQLVPVAWRAQWAPMQPFLLE
jgi:hemerythrin-like domain-containing protein